MLNFVKSEKRATYDKIEAFFAEKGLPLLQSRVELLIGYKEKRSTLFSLPERELEKLGLGNLILEILSIVLGPGQVTPSGKTVTMPSQPGNNPDSESSNTPELPSAPVVRGLTSATAATSTAATASEDSL